MAQGSTAQVVRESERVLPVAHTPEVLVVGRGIASIMAALPRRAERRSDGPRQSA